MFLKCGIGEDSWESLQVDQTSLETASRSNQSILKKINPEYSLEWLMLKLKLQYFGHLIRTANSLEKTLTLGKIEDKRRRGQQRMRWLDGITSSMDMNLDELQDMVRDWEAWSATVPRVTKSQTQLSEWTTTKDTRWEGEGKCPVLSYFLPSWEAAKKNQAKCILKFHIEISGMG